ncbi:MAG: hypothetical protein CVV63_02455, partial [Tenericutes bacterium HGW-Tenericutes-8]
MRQKQLKYYGTEALGKQKAAILNKIANIETRTKHNDENIEKLLQKDKHKHIRKIVKLADQNQKMKIKLSRYTDALSQIESNQYVKQSILSRFKKWFSDIPYRKQKYIWGIIFTTPWLIGMALFFLPSFFKSIWWSFNSVTPSSDGLVVQFVGLKNYIELFQSYVIDGNTVFSVQLYLFIQNLIIDLPIILIFSILIATFLNKPFKGHKIIKAIFFIPVIYNFTLISDTLTKGFGQYIDASTGADQMFVAQLSQFFLEIGIGNSLMNIVLQAVDRIFTIVNLSGIQILIFIAAIQSIPNQL